MSEPTTTEDAQSIAKEAIENQRPISATAGRNLLKIVKNDFDQIKADLAVWRTNEIKKRQEEYQISTSGETQEGLQEEAQEIYNRARQEFDAFRARAAAAGFSVHNMELNIYRSPQVKNDNTARRLREIEQEVRGQYDQAYELAEREYLRCERMVLMATVTGEAEKILSVIPSATTLVSQAIEQNNNIKELA